MDSEAGRTAIRACYGLLAARGEATPDVFKQAVYTDHTAGYISPNDWWAAISTGLRNPAEQRDDLQPPPGDDHWRV